MRFCQPCLSWVCTEKPWPGYHFDKCWDIEDAEGTNRWRMPTGKLSTSASAHAECLPTIGQMFADLMCRTLRSLTLRSLTLESGDSIANDGGKCSKSTLRLRLFEDVPCIVYNGGVVLGFQLRVSNLHCMRDLSEPLVSAWTRMHELGILGGPADTDTRHPCRAGARQGRREAADPRP